MLASNRARVSALSLLLVGGAGSGFARPAHRAPVHGFTYTIHVSTTPRGDAGAEMGAAAMQDWTARATAANGRGRLDMVNGQAAGMWSAGDYLLFDSTEFVIVHPTTKQFIAIPSDLASRSLEQMKANGVDISLTGVTGSMQPVAGPDSSVAGFPTKHYKLDMTYSLGMSMGTLQQSISTKVTSDIWVARVADLPANPFLRASSMQGAGLMQEITRTLDSIAKPIKGMIPLRSVTVTELSGAAPTAFATEQRVEVSDLAPADVNDDLLYLPADFTAGTLPGLTNVPGDSVVAKWRRPAGGGKR